MEEQNQTENIIIKKNRGRPATKHGNYDNKQYYATFKEKNQIKIHEVEECKICYGRFSYYNRSHHNNSLKHRKAVNNLNNEEAINKLIVVMKNDEIEKENNL